MSGQVEQVKTAINPAQAPLMPQNNMPKDWGPHVFEYFNYHERTGLLPCFSPADGVN